MWLFTQKCMAHIDQSRGDAETARCAHRHVCFQKKTDCVQFPVLVLLAVWPWTSYFIIRGPHLLIQKMEMMALPHKAALRVINVCEARGPVCFTKHSDM